MTKLNPRQHAAKEKAERALRRKCDRLAVKCVTIVSLRMIGSGSGTRFLGAYDGIEACREIRALLIKRFK